MPNHPSVSDCIESVSMKAATPPIASARRAPARQLGTLPEARQIARPPKVELSHFDEVERLDKLSELLSQVGEAIVQVDRNWVVHFCNDTYLQNLAKTREEVIGKTPFDYVPLFKRSIFYEAIEHCRATRKPMSRIGYSTVLGRWLMVRVFPLANGGMVMLANDASESVVKQYHLAQRAAKDQLTGLGNKLAMEQLVEQMLKRKEEFSIIVLGLVRFKSVNEAHGYATGDMALLEVASSLQSATLQDETLFRVSGDEFAIVSLAQGPQVEARAEALLDSVKRPIVFQWIRIVLAACAGAVQSPKDGDEYELLLKRAMLALRESKKIPQSSFAMYKAEYELASQMRSVLEAELRLALDGSQFKLLIQPKVSMSTGEVVGGESLIRWAHPKRGLMAPAAFLGIAQEIGAMISLDHWVLRQTLKYIAELLVKGKSVPISINLSVDSLADIYLADRIADALEEAKVPPSLLEVEIPEGALMHDVAGSERVLEQLHRMGVKISIDDFGTGYSSFAYLAQFPVHALKVDRSFVTDICASEKNKTVVASLVRLAHALKLEVVAEGAETAEQVALLKRLKCDSVQGYFFAKPLSWIDFQRYSVPKQTSRRPNPMSI